MINSNGTLVSKLSQQTTEVESHFLHGLHIVESIHADKGQLLFWELHYFRVMAAMRQLRFVLPINFTALFFEEEIQKTLAANKLQSKDVLIYLHLLCNSQNQSPHFVIEVQESISFQQLSHAAYSMDIYKEAFISAQYLSNISLLNAPIRAVASVYANENGWQDCFLMNEQKELVESTQGSIFILNDHLIQTPSLQTGCQNLVIREAFIQWIKQKQTAFEVEEKTLSPFVLQNAQEILILSSEKGGNSIDQYRKTQYKHHVFQKLYGEFIGDALKN